MLRYAGLFTWAAVGLWLIIFLIDPQALPLEDLDGQPMFRVLRWLVVYLLFGAAYWRITRSLGDRKPGIWDHFGLLLLTACALGVSYFSGTALGSILLMVVAGLLPWILPLKVGVVWLVLGNLAVVPIYTGPLGFPLLMGLMQALGYMGFSSFVFTVTQRSYCDDVGRSSSQHLTSFFTNCQNFIGVLVQCHYRWLIHYDTLSFNINEYIGCTQVNTDFHSKSHVLFSFSQIKYINESFSVSVFIVYSPLYIIY